ncbi:MAG: peptidoglycan DD-metalloendopeptidase family protein [Bacilli bacterium]
MDEVYSSKFMKKKTTFNSKKYVSKLLNRILFSIVIYLVAMIFINSSESNKELFQTYVLEKNFNFSGITSTYNKYFGDVLPIEVPEEKMVFNESLTYKDITEYKDGFSLNVGKNYLMPTLKSGLIVFVGEKEDYGNTIIIQGIDGVNIWYSHINLVDYSLYDYVEEGTFLGEATEDNIYLVFSKDGNYIGYEEYFD